MISAIEALGRLKEGNKRYVLGDFSTKERFTAENRSHSLREGGAKPFAVILACSDARAPVELIFDQGIGDLFVVRVAGNIAASSQIGSIEFAVSSWQVPLLIVLGHSECGAVSTVLKNLKGEKEEPSSPNILSLLSPVRSALEKAGKSCDMEKAVEANLRFSIKEIYRNSELIKRAVDKQELTILGAKYSLAKGIVEFYD